MKNQANSPFLSKMTLFHQFLTNALLKPTKVSKESLLFPSQKHIAKTQFNTITQVQYRRLRLQTNYTFSSKNNQIFHEKCMMQVLPTFISIILLFLIPLLRTILKNEKANTPQDCLASLFLLLPDQMQDFDRIQKSIRDKERRDSEVLLEGGEVHGIVHEHGGVGGVVVTEGLIDYDGDVKDSSLVAGLSDHSAPGRRGRGRSDRVLPLQ